MEMIKSRNQTSHTYNEDTALDISNRVICTYAKLFEEFESKLNESNEYGLSKQTIEDLRYLYPQIEEVMIYRSRAKGNFRPGSDIDLTLKGKSLTLKRDAIVRKK